MLGVTVDTGSLNKRKRISSTEKPSKRARSESSEEDAQAQILLLENETFESKKNYNNIAKLIKILRDDNEDADNSVVAAISLCRVFVRLMTSGEMAKKQGSTEKEAVVVKWLKERYSEYKISLLLFLGEEGVDATALTLCMRLLKTEGEHLRNTQDYNFPTSFLTEIIQVLLQPDGGEAVRAEFGNKYVEEYDDIRFYTFKSIKSVLLLILSITF
jgi:U3 small nucleolar RNA-associated protein 19